MARGGFRPGAGRPKGARSKPKVATPAKATRKAAAKPRKTVETTLPPLPSTTPSSPQAASPKKFATAIEFAMDAINNPDVDITDKVRLAIALMPFQAPKLAEQKPDTGKGGKKPLSSKFAPPPPPGSKPQLAVSND